MRAGRVKEKPGGGQSNPAFVADMTLRNTFPATQFLGRAEYQI